MKILKDLNLKDQIVLVRTDYNVPLEDGVVASDLRIRASLPTLQTLLELGAAKIILISHLGRPDGQPKPELSLAPVATQLQELLPGKVVKFCPATVGPEVKQAVQDLPEKGILLLENLRFDPREEQNDAKFAEEIVAATGATAFVQDGFAVIHRAHASTAALPRLLPAAAGPLVEKEVSTLTKAVENPDRPLLVIIGGAKVADKQPLIDRFLPIADQIVVGGKIAADGYTASDSKVYVAEDFDSDATGAKLDLGPLSAAEILTRVVGSKTVIWNGCLGKTEDPAFATTSEILATFLGEYPDVTSIICGGDTTGFVEQLQKTKPKLKFSLISTGGGAALELLTGAKLPGLAALD